MFLGAAVVLLLVVHAPLAVVLLVNDTMCFVCECVCVCVCV